MTAKKVKAEQAQELKAKANRHKAQRQHSGN
jgi:hypothetical protein